jgi:hypothetical protein
MGCDVDVKVVAMHKQHSLKQLARASDRCRIVVAIELVGPFEHHLALCEL